MTQTLTPPAATATTGDRIRSITLSHVVLPLPNPVSDAKVLTGRQKPLTETVLLFVEVTTEQGHEGHGLQLLQAGRRQAQFAHLQEVAEVAIGQDPSDIARIYESLMWAGASVGRSGVATQAVAALDVALYDLKARRAGLPLAKLLGAHRDSCARLQHLRRLPPGLRRGDQGEGDRLARGRHRRHQDQGRPARLARGPAPGRGAARAPRRRPVHGRRQPAVGPRPRAPDVPRARAVRPGLDRGATRRAGTHVGHADLSQTFDTPIATGEMLTSVDEHMGLVNAGYRGIVQPDAPRIGGITPFLRFATLAAHHRLDLAPHYAMEIHLHLAATYPTEPWVEHFEWLDPLFEERIDIHDGQIFVPDRPGLGFTLTERMRSLTVETATFST